MFILRHGSVNVKGGLLEENVQPSTEPQYCHRCGGGLRVSGKYWREVIRAGEIVRIPLYRGYCQACRMTKLLYPTLPKARSHMFLSGPDCKDVQEYLREYVKKSPDPGHCPLCGRRLRKHAHYWRWVIQVDEIVSIPLYRAYCPKCRKTGVLYPTFLKPYARYESILRERVLEKHLNRGEPWSQAAKETFTACGEVPQPRTLRRWARDLVEKAPEVNKTLAGWLAKWDPFLNQHSLLSTRVGERSPAQVLFRYGAWFLSLLDRLSPGGNLFAGGLFVFLRRQSETAGILL